MPPIEDYLERADALAQEVVNEWGMQMRLGNSADIRHEFMAVFEKACQYRDAKHFADNHREFNSLTEEDSAQEATTRRAFAEAYKDMREQG